MIITQDWQLLYTDIYYISTKSATLWNSAVLVLLHSTSQCHKRQFNTVDSALRLIWENLPICTNEQVLTLLLGVAIFWTFFSAQLSKNVFFLHFWPVLGICLAIYWHNLFWCSHFNSISRYFFFLAICALPVSGKYDTKVLNPNVELVKRVAAKSADAAKDILLEKERTIYF